MSAQQTDSKITATEGGNVFSIPDGNLHRFEAEIARINRRAKKLGFEPVKVKKLGSEIKKRVSEVMDAFGNYPDIVWTVHKFEVEGQQPVLSGWQFLGKLEHIDPNGMNIVKGNVPIQFATCKPNCDHCKKFRPRAETFILKNLESDDLMQVGKSCLTDFFNGDDPMKCAAFMELMYSMGEDLRDFESEYGGGGGGQLHFPPADILTMTAAVVEKYGWITSAKAEEMCMESTASDVRRRMTQRPAPGAKPDIVINESHREKAAVVLAWLREPETVAKAADSTFMHNLVVLASVDAIPAKNIGILAAAMVAYDKHLASLAHEKIASTSEHVGKKDEKLESYPLTVIGTTIIPREMYGDKKLYRFKDSDGNLLVWFSSNVDIARVGDRIHINGTIKEHDVYRNAKQTGLLRVNTNEQKLYKAIESDKEPAAIAKLLKKMSVNLDQGPLGDGITPLMLATRRGDVAMMRTLLDAGANPDFHYIDSEPPLFFALAHGWKDCIDLLQEYGANFNCTAQRHGQTITFEQAQEIAQAELRYDFCRYMVDTEQAAVEGAHWHQDKAFPLAKLETPDGGWVEWLRMRSAELEEVGGTEEWRFRQYYEGCYRDQQITVTERDGRFFLQDRDSQKALVAASIRDGKTVYPARVAVIQATPEKIAGAQPAAPAPAYFTFQ